MTTDNFSVGDLYEPYVGRWSRLVARDFVSWLEVPADRDWLDVGCGTGALTETILDVASPASVTGVDPSEGFVAYAQEKINDPRVRFEVGDAQALPIPSDSMDSAVAGLALNFVPDPSAGLAEMVRATRSNGVVAAYVWDYAGKMELMRYFWDAASALDPGAADLDEGSRFPICDETALGELFATRLSDVEVRAIDVPTVFADHDDYWTPFLGGVGPAPAYVMSLDHSRREALRERLTQMLPMSVNGTIEMIARAWAAKGVSP